MPPSKRKPSKGKPVSKRLKESSFYRNIYLRRNELKHVSLLKESSCWPKSVYVMDETFDIDGPVWNHPVNGEPCTIYAWAELHFKELYSAPLDQVVHALRIWWGLHEQIITYLITKKIYRPGMERLVYNTTWTLLGYEVNQDPAALDLAHTIRLDPSFERCGIDLKNKDISIAQKEIQWPTAKEWNDQFSGKREVRAENHYQEKNFPAFRTASRSGGSTQTRSKKKPPAGLKKIES